MLLIEATYRIALNRGPKELCDKFLSHIHHFAFRGTDRQGLFLDSFEVLLLYRKSVFHRFRNS